jgi:hypothetical protein
MSRFRRRYTIIDHENGQMVEAGKHMVLNPAANFADYAALITMSENVEPELAADLIEHLASIDQFPNRQLSKYGIECLPHIKHPSVRPAAHAYAKRNGLYIPK